MASLTKRLILPKGVTLKPKVSIDLSIQTGREGDVGPYQLVIRFYKRSELGITRPLIEGPRVNLPQLTRKEWMAAYDLQKDLNCDPDYAIHSIAARYFIRNFDYVLDHKGGSSAGYSEFEVCRTKKGRLDDGIETCERISMKDACEFFCIDTDKLEEPD